MVGVDVGAAGPWHRIEDAARERQVSPNQLVVELARHSRSKPTLSTSRRGLGSW